MFCIHCGSKIGDTSKFCPICGQRVAIVQPKPIPTPAPIPEPVPEPIPEPVPEPIPEPVPEPIPEPVPEPIPEPIPEPVVPIAEPVPQLIVEPAPAPVADSILASAAAPAPITEPVPVQEIPCAHCGTMVKPDAKFCSNCGKNPQPTPKKEKKAKKKGAPIALFIILGIVALVVAVAIAGVCTNWFGFYGPASKITAAADKTAKAGSFTLEATIIYENDDGAEEKQEATAYIVIDPENRELTFYSYQIDEYGYGYEQAIYDGYSIYHRTSEIGSGYYEYENIKEELDSFFDTYESTSDMDWDELFDLIDEKTDIGDYMDSKATIKCAKSYLRKLNSNKWLKENAGFSTERVNGATVYSFEPKLYTFLDTSLDCFEGAFEDEDDFEDLKKELKGEKKELNSIDFSLSFGVKGGKLETIAYETKSGDVTTTVEMELTNIGSTEIDMDDMADLLQEAKDYESDFNYDSEW